MVWKLRRMKNLGENFKSRKSEDLECLNNWTLLTQLKI